MGRKWHVDYCGVCGHRQKLLIPIQPGEHVRMGANTKGLCTAPSMRTGNTIIRQLGPMTTERACGQIVPSVHQN